MAMDSKKRKVKADENGAPADEDDDSLLLRRLIQSIGTENLVDILADASSRHADIREQVRRVADMDTAARKLFVRGLGWETKASHLEDAFKPHGELEETNVIVDKGTGKSKGYGFVTFKHAEDALKALREPNKKIDGRNTVCQLASLGPSQTPAPFPAATTAATSGPPGSSSDDQILRKIYVGNVPADASPEKLLSIFSKFGEIEKGPLGFDRKTGKCKGFALFLYKSASDAKRSIQESVKEIDGHKIYCKMAGDNNNNNNSNNNNNPKKRGVDGSNLDYSSAVANNFSSFSGMGAGSGLSLGAFSSNPLTAGLLGQGAGLAGLNQGVSAQGLNPGLSQFRLSAGMNPNVAQHLGFNPGLGTSLSQSYNQPMSSGLLSSLSKGSSQNLSQPLSQIPNSLGSSAYDLHGMSSYGSQVPSLGSSQVGGYPGASGTSQTSYQGSGMQPMSSLALARAQSYSSHLV